MRDILKDCLALLGLIIIGGCLVLLAIGFGAIK